MRLIDADAQEQEILALTISPWYRSGKSPDEGCDHLMYLARKEAVGTVLDLCCREAPTVPDVQQVRHGRWMYGNSAFPWMKCSECGGIVTPPNAVYNYCPSCGARMNGVKE